MGDTSPKDRQRGTDTGPQGTRVFRRESIEQHFQDRAADTTASSEAASGAVLIGINGSFKGRRFAVPNGRSTLGRDDKNDLVIDDDSVSLVHARLVEKDGQYRVLNMLSTNGTWVNNRKVSDAALNDGDAVCFGEAEFIFQQTQSSAHRGGVWGTLRRWLGGGR